MEDDLNFDFERALEPPNAGETTGSGPQRAPDLPPGANIGQSIGNFKKNYRQTVCTYWLRGLCMKGDTCGFLHQFATERMPICRTLLKFGVCKEPDCPYKHDLSEIKECNMYKLGFCVYGPQCRYKHTRQDGPPPPIDNLEAAKPREFRNINVVVNSVNTGITTGPERGGRRPRSGSGGEQGQIGGREPVLRITGGPPGPRPAPPRPPPGAPPMSNMPPNADSSLLAAVGQQGFPYGF